MRPKKASGKNPVQVKSFEKLAAGLEESCPATSETSLQALFSDLPHFLPKRGKML